MLGLLSGALAADAGEASFWLPEQETRSGRRQEPSRSSPMGARLLL